MGIGRRGGRGGVVVGRGRDRRGLLLRIMGACIYDWVVKFFMLDILRVENWILKES